MINAIEIKNLNKNYQDFQLKDVSFKVPKGSIVGFIGENGAGKTTTIKAILNLVKRDGGTIEMLGMDTSIDHVTDFSQIAAYGVMTTPALVVDGKVLSYGKVLKAGEAAELIKKARA